jgi:ABC-type sugar transport system ATPase subunit
MRLTASRITKSYGGVRVLHAVDFDVHGGEVHALVGENGAGKSTLIKVLGGAVSPDSGDVLLDDQRLPLGDPLETRRLGISIVYQEFTLVPGLSVADNIFLGRERGRWRLRLAETRQAARNLLDQLGLSLDVDAPVAGLSVAHQQMVEIARALAFEARVLILDEPTASLSEHETLRLFETVRRLRAGGLAVIYISHRLEEVLAIADRITVLRDGRTVGTSRPSEIDRPTIVRWMVGRDLAEEFPARAHASGAVVLEVRDLAARPRFSNVNFTVRAGEIVALAGLVGAGRTSAALAIAGGLPCTGGVLLGGSPVRFRSPDSALAAGLAYVTEDRKAFGLFPRMDVRENITISSLRTFATAGIVSMAGEREAAQRAVAEFDVRARGLAQHAGTLSGGNQQKVLVARFLLEPRRVVILDEPTRGVDVGARAEIYLLMNRLVARGLGVLMISSDLPEVLGMADRIVIMREGITVGELDRNSASAERVMALATGTH